MRKINKIRLNRLIQDYKKVTGKTKSKIIKRRRLYFGEGGEEGEEKDKDYISVVKKVKKENITPDNIAEIMLCQIPGISSVTAIAIMDKFKTIPNLIQEIQQNDNCLKDISYQNSKGQSRKINKTSLVNIVKFLMKK